MQCISCFHAFAGLVSALWFPPEENPEQKSLPFLDLLWLCLPTFESIFIFPLPLLLCPHLQQDSCSDVAGWVCLHCWPVNPLSSPSSTDWYSVCAGWLQKKSMPWIWLRFLMKSSCSIEALPMTQKSIMWSNHGHEAALVSVEWLWMAMLATRKSI